MNIGQQSGNPSPRARRKEKILATEAGKPLGEQKSMLHTPGLQGARVYKEAVKIGSLVNLTRETEKSDGPPTHVDICRVCARGFSSRSLLSARHLQHILTNIYVIKVRCGSPRDTRA